VDEACAAVLSFPGPASTLTMRVIPGGERIEVVVRSDAETDTQRWPPPDMEGSLAWRVLSGLADEASFAVDGGPAVRVAFRGTAG
jgi:hypothetical protein